MRGRLDLLLSNWTSEDTSSTYSQDVFKEITLVPGHTRIADIGSDKNDEIMEGGCSAWMSYWRGGDLSAHTSTQITTKLQLVEATRDLSDLTSFNDTKSVVCSEKESVRSILEQISRTSSSFSEQPTTCNGTEWVVRACTVDEVVIPALCVNCSISVLNSMCQEATSCNNTMVYGDSFMLAPCSRSHCQTRRPSSFVRLFTADFLEKSPPPDILSSEITSTNTVIEVKSTISSDGMMYCMNQDINTNTASASPSVMAVMLENNMASAVYNSSSMRYNIIITLTGLQPGTDVRIYCLTVSSQGVKMSDVVMKSQSEAMFGVVSTLCCKPISMSLTTANFFEGVDQRDAFSINLAFLPRNNVTLQFNLVQYLNGTGTLNHSDKIIPSMISFSNYSKITELSTKLSVMRSMAGSYSIHVVLGGPSSYEFKDVFPRGKDFMIYTVDQEPATPSVRDATFAHDGSRVEIEFSANTNQG